MSRPLPPRSAPASDPEAIARLLTSSLAASALIDLEQSTLLGRRTLRGWIGRRTATGVEIVTAHGRLEIATSTIVSARLVRCASS